MAQAIAQETAPAEGEAADAHATDDHATDGATELHATTEASHGAGEEHGAFPPFDPSGFGGQLLWLAITFAVLYVLMSRAALPRIGGILEERRLKIAADLEEADKLRVQTEEAVATYEAELADARAKSLAVAEEARQKVRAEIEAKRNDVEAGLAKTMTDAEKRIAKSKDAALGHVDEIAASTARAVVAQLAGDVTDKAARDAVSQVLKG